MTIRIIVRDCDEGAARHVGGPVQTRIKSFDVELPELEQFLRAEGQPDYISRQVMGVELLDATPGLAQAEPCFYADHCAEEGMCAEGCAVQKDRAARAAGVDLPDGAKNG